MRILDVIYPPPKATFDKVTVQLTHDEVKAFRKLFGGITRRDLLNHNQSDVKATDYEYNVLLAVWEKFDDICRG